MNKQFLKALFKKIHRSILNNHKDNWDEFRFGEQPDPSWDISEKLTDILKYLKYGINATGIAYFPSKAGNTDALESFSYLFSLLHEDRDRDLLIDLVAYRILGYKKIRLITNWADAKLEISKLNRLADPTDSIVVKFNQMKLDRMDLNPIGIPIDFYFSPSGVYTDFTLEQYKYQNGKTIIKAQPGDYVIDAGGCWGDTALYFANAVGESGRVFTYEFIPSNLLILRKNLSLNPKLESRVTIVPNPVWSSSSLNLQFNDNGPGSRVFFEGDGEADGIVETLSIDDLVASKEIEKIDFIKMDIEGAEPHALAGAIKTIQRFRPSMAIAIYHNTDDFYTIPKFIADLGLGYKFHLGHYTIHREETILFATAR